MVFQTFSKEREREKKKRNRVIDRERDLQKWEYPNFTTLHVYSDIFQKTERDRERRREIERQSDGGEESERVGDGNRER